MDSLAEPGAGPASIFVNELDALRFEGPLYDVEGGSTWLVGPRLQLTHRYDANSSLVCKDLLTPIEKATRGPALLWCDHQKSMPETADSINSIENRLTQRMYLL
jgi:hypothetical protein